MSKDNLRLKITETDSHVPFDLHLELKGDISKGFNNVRMSNYSSAVSDLHSLMKPYPNHMISISNEEERGNETVKSEWSLQSYAEVHNKYILTQKE